MEVQKNSSLLFGSFNVMEFGGECFGRMREWMLECFRIVSMSCFCTFCCDLFSFISFSSNFLAQNRTQSSEKHHHAPRMNVNTAKLS